MKKKQKEIRDYDRADTAGMINRTKKLSLGDLGFDLPAQPPSQVISIRLPTPLLNQIKAKASSRDVPYQALIKILLAQSVKRMPS